MAVDGEMVFARMDADTRRRIEDEANNRFHGNRSMVVRTAVELYLALREDLGPRFEIVIDDLRKNGKVAA